MEKKEKSKIGLFSAVCIIVGGAIGSAIFSLSGLTIYKAGPSSILSWIIAALIMGLYALVCSELSVRYPYSGGVFVFPRKILGKNKKQGEFWGWLSTWGYINANIVAISFASIYVGTYLSVSFPIFNGYGPLLSGLAILFVFWLNSIKFSLLGKINIALVFVLVVTMLIYVVTGLTSPSWSEELFHPFFTQGSDGKFGFLTSVPIAMVAYGSIVSITFMAGEVKNPKRNIPLSILIALIVILALYISIIVTTSGLVSADFLKENPGMRYIPLYAAAFTSLKNVSFLSPCISIAAFLALITTMLVVMNLTSLAIKEAAVSKILPSVFSKNNRFGVPMNASLLVAFPSLVLSFFPSLTELIVSLASLFASITIVINCVSLMKVKLSKTKEDVSFSLPFGITIPLVAAIVICICYIPDIISGGYKIWLYTIAWYAIGCAYFFIRLKCLSKKGCEYGRDS